MNLKIQKKHQKMNKNNNQINNLSSQKSQHSYNSQQDQMDVADQFNNQDINNKKNYEQQGQNNKNIKNTNKFIQPRVDLFIPFKKNSKDNIVTKNSNIKNKPKQYDDIIQKKNNLIKTLKKLNKNNHTDQKLSSSKNKVQSLDNTTTFTDHLIKRCLFQSDISSINKSKCQSNFNNTNYNYQTCNANQSHQNVNSQIKSAKSYQYQELLSMLSPKSKSKCKQKNNNNNKKKDINRVSFQINKQRNNKLWQSKQCKRCCEKSAQKQQKDKTSQLKSPQRTFQKFLQDQNQYSAKKQARISSKRSQVKKIEEIQLTYRPIIDKNSNRIANQTLRRNQMQERQNNLFLCNSSAVEQKNKCSQVYERLSKLSKEKSLKSKSQRKMKTSFDQQQCMFSPKILSRSKDLNRSSNVSQLLYNDAIRRQDKQKFMQKQLNNKPPLTPNINKNTSKLVLKKIRSEFQELIEGSIQKDQKISPILGISILSELFNVDLNPTKNYQTEQLCHKILGFLIDQQITQQSNNRQFQSKKSQDNQTVINIKRLWKFIQILISYNQTPIYQQSGRKEENLIFSIQEQQQIYNSFSYFYMNRVAKQRKPKTPQRLSFQPQTLQRSKKMAAKHRQRILTSVNDFIQNQNAVKLSNFQIQGGSALKKSYDSNKNVAKMISSQFQPLSKQDQKSQIRIQDLFIAQYMKKKVDNQNKKRDKEAQQLASCTFKPKTNQNYNKNSSRKLNIKIINKINSRNQLKTVNNCNNQSMLYDSKLENSNFENSYVKQNNKKQANIQKNGNKHKFATKFNKQNTNRPIIKNMQKTLLRMSYGRKQRQLSNTSKLRQYPDCRQISNYQEYQRLKKKDLIQSSKRLKGYQSINKY